MNTNKTNLVIGFGIIIVLAIGGVIYSFSKNSSPAVPGVGDETDTTTQNGSITTSKPTTVTPKPKLSPPLTLNTFGVDFVSPVLGPVGSTVIIHGNSFSKTGNSVILNKNAKIYINNVSSPDGKTITIQIPRTAVIDGKTTALETGTYDVSVRNAKWEVSNIVSFVVTE